MTLHRMQNNILNQSAQSAHEIKIYCVRMNGRAIKQHIFSYFFTIKKHIFLSYPVPSKRPVCTLGKIMIIMDNVI